MTNLFIEIYQNPSLLPYNKQMITRELLDKASFGRRESPKQIAYQLIQLVQLRTQLLPILQNEICRSYFKTSLCVLGLSFRIITAQGGALWEC